VKLILDTTAFNADKLILAPDCGLAMLKRDAVLRGLNSMVEASKLLREHYGRRELLNAE